MTTLRGGKTGSISRLKKSLKKSSGGNAITNIPEAGLVVRFLSEPDEWVEYFEHYDQANKQMVLCTDDCQLCRENLRASKRYLTNAVDTEESKVIALKLPVTAASQVIKKYDRYKTLLDRDYSILKEGTGMDTEYDVNPEAPSRFNVAKYDALDLWDLLTKQLEGQSDSDDDDDDDEEDERPTRRSRSTGKRRPVKINKGRDEDDDEEIPSKRRAVAGKRRVVKK